MAGSGPGRRLAACGVVALFLTAACTDADRIPTDPPTPTGTGTAAAPEVTVSTGTLRGRVEGTGGDAVLRYRGVPFAAAPVGELRFAAPAAAPAWEGVRDATDAGPRCPQPVSPPYGTGPPLPASTDEDCLTLDVTAPVDATAGDDLPVLVWVHGGGFATGAGGDYDPRALVTETDVVVVTVNYRLGALGFLELPGVEGAGSFGLLDQQAALRWVRAEIGAFGGNPGEVTVAGESAGGDSVCALVTNPEATGLFQRAILQSAQCGGVNVVDTLVPGLGPAVDTWRDPQVATSGDAAWVTGLGCPDPVADAGAALACLRGRDVADLTTAPATTTPVVGSPGVPERPSDVIAAGDAHRIPMIVGTTSDEGATFVSAAYAESPLDAESLRRNAETLLPEDSAELLAVYGASAAGADPARVWADVVTDRVWACPSLRTADDVRAAGSEVRFSEFADAGAAAVQGTVAPELQGAGAPHAAELPYLFDLPGVTPPADSSAALAEQLRRAWGGFVTTGAPYGWPATGEPGESSTPVVAAMLRFDPPSPEIALLSSYRAQHRCDFWDSVDGESTTDESTAGETPAAQPAD